MKMLFFLYFRDLYGVQKYKNVIQFTNEIHILSLKYPWNYICFCVDTNSSFHAESESIRLCFVNSTCSALCENTSYLILCNAIANFETTLIMIIIIEQTYVPSAFLMWKNILLHAHFYLEARHIFGPFSCLK